eukprot:276842-Hanusia_phi.AAC.2
MMTRTPSPRPGSAAGAAGAWARTVRCADPSPQMIRSSARIDSPAVPSAAGPHDTAPRRRIGGPRPRGGTTVPGSHVTRTGTVRSPRIIMAPVTPMMVGLQ